MIMRTLGRTNYFKFYKDVDAAGAVVEKAILELGRVISQPQKASIHKRLQAYAKTVPILVRMIGNQQELIHALLRENETLKGGTPTAHRRRWSDEEDQALIDEATKEDTSMITLALGFNRTPAAVSSRLTYLVGIHRISEHVVAHITGYLNGNEVEGDFIGDLVRK
jgi:hypothetical protein